jgi:hypothetical protein
MSLLGNVPRAGTESRRRGWGYRGRKGEEGGDGTEGGWTTKSRSDVNRGGWARGVARGPTLRLDSKGVFEALHARLQVLNLTLLLGQEEVFDPAQSLLDLGHILLDLADIVGHVVEPCVDHAGQVFNGGWFGAVLCHMYSSIAGVRGVSMVGVVEY